MKDTMLTTTQDRRRWQAYDIKCVEVDKGEETKRELESLAF
jgi:hypothetical protein